MTIRKETQNRMENLVTTTKLDSMVENLEVLIQEWQNEGFDKNDIKALLNTYIDRL